MTSACLFFCGTGRCATCFALAADTACDKVMKTSGMGGGDLKGDLANNHLLFSYALFSIIVRI